MPGRAVKEEADIPSSLKNKKRYARQSCKRGSRHTIKLQKREKVCLPTLLNKEEKGGEQGEKYGGPGCIRSDLCDNGGKNFPAMASVAFFVEGVRC